MELLMWVGIYALLIVINGTVSSKLDNEHEAINLENVFATSDKTKCLQIIRFLKVSELFVRTCVYPHTFFFSIPLVGVSV